jgi:excisionase family DNA binding protein
VFDPAQKTGGNMATTPARELLTRAEAAEFLGVAAQTLALWYSTGRYRLPAIKVGRLVRYRRADLEKWLAARTEHAGR